MLPLRLGSKTGASDEEDELTNVSSRIKIK